MQNKDAMLDKRMPTANMRICEGFGKKGGSVLN